MSVAKIAISIDRDLLKKLDQLVEEEKFESRSQAIQLLLKDKVIELARYRFERECDKLDPEEEVAMAEEGLYEDTKEWEKF